MSKLSFSEKQNQKKKLELDYSCSYLELFKFNLKKKSEKTVKKYAKSHSVEETNRFSNDLELENEVKIKFKEEKLHKKALKHIDHIDKVETQENKRVWEVDFVRGFIIIGMLIDHFIGDFWMTTRPLHINRANDFFTNMYQFSVAYWNHPARVSVRLLGVALLLVVSGISAKFSKKSWFHALLILAFGGIMSAVFGVIAIYTGDFTMNVMMGAITCIGLCLLIYSLVRMLFYKLGIGKHFKWFALFFAVSILVMWGFASYLNPDRLGDYNFWFIYNNYAPVIKNIQTPDDLRKNVWKALIGLNYFGADWLPLFPYLGYMFLGGFIGETLYKNKESFLRFFKSKGERSLNARFNHATRGVTFFGKKSMWFYLLHQPVFIVIIVLIALIMGLSITI